MMNGYTDMRGRTGNHGEQNTNSIALLENLSLILLGLKYNIAILMTSLDKGQTGQHAPLSMSCHLKMILMVRGARSSFIAKVLLVQ